MKMTSPLILTPQQWTAIDRLKARIWRGKSKGTTGGSLVSDLSALQKTMLLCSSCQHKFDWKRHGYYSVFRYEHQPVIGPCGVCLEQVTGNDGRLFIHEEIRPQTWATPDEKKNRMATMRRIAQTRHTFPRR